MGRVSLKSTKKGRFSDLLYDVDQQKSILVSCDREGRSVDNALEDSPSGDRSQVVIDAALDEQNLDLDYRDDLDVSLISIDEAS